MSATTGMCVCAKARVKTTLTRGRSDNGYMDTATQLFISNK